MTPRVRRLSATLVAIVALLFAGRWSVSFIAERWWGATVSPGAASFITRWHLLGFALDAGTIIIASTWFALHALLVARVITSVQVAHRIGDLQLREAVPTRVLLGGAVAAGVLLGLIAGAGAHAWRQPILLAWQGVSYGIQDPLLHRDLGLYVAQLPVWDLAHRFAMLLAVLGIGFGLTLYAGIGAVRREKRTLVLHPDARRHLGGLLAFAALVVSAGYLLVPFHLAASGLTEMTPAGALARIHAAETLTGLAAATALLTLLWAWRGRNSVLVAAWIVLAIGAGCERFLVAALTEDVPPTPSRLAGIRRLDAIAWGMRPVGRVIEADSVPFLTALWDESMLAALAERSGGMMEAATQGIAVVGGRPVPAWYVAMSAPGDSTRLDVLAVADGATTSGGAAILLHSDDIAPSARPVWRTVANPRVRPAAPPWRSVASGVTAGSPFRRLLLAWARQEPGLLRDPPQPAFDWHIAPTDRAAAILPMLVWLPADLALVNGRAFWVVQGIVTVDRFPLATRAMMAGRRVSGASPAVICTVDAASGATRFFVDPAADSLGVAWSRVAGSVVAPASALDPAVRSSLGYAPEWLGAQVRVLHGPTWNGGQSPQVEGGVPVSAPVWVSAGVPGRQMVLDESGRGGIVWVATGHRADGIPQLRIERREADGTAAGRRIDLRQLWAHSPSLMHLRDSALAAGDSATFGAERWYDGRDALAAWQPLFAVPHRGPPTLLWVSTAIADKIGGGRTPSEAWLSASAPAGTGDARSADTSAMLEQARQWLARADSAFRRGDMTAFGRAYEALRSVLAR